MPSTPFPTRSSCRATASVTHNEEVTAKLAAQWQEGLDDVYRAFESHDGDVVILVVMAVSLSNSRH